ncbi:MAG: Stk1 family PASTA domain-containing Ser/Thr kinase [Actinomycetota bacterium]
MVSQVGRVYGGRYQIEKSIASGGMAEVFEARDEQLQRTVALKLMHPEYARDKTFINRFRREAQAAASLNDPRVVAIYDWGSDNGAYYIVMEYVDGKTLREIIQDQGPLSPERSVEIAADICAGLEPAHNNGIVHRDIKSSNVAVANNGQTKIMDFGIARAASAMEGQTMTQTGTVIGTANYFSPEQAQGMPVDQRSDLYSVGVILYEMLTKELPFKGDSAVAIAYKHVQEDATPPSQLNPDIPSGLDSVVMKALAKNPDNRYQTAAEMRMDLRRLLTGEQVEATPILSPDQTALMQSSDRTTVLPAPAMTGTSGRRKAVAYFLSVVLIASVLALAGVFLFSLFGSGGTTVVVPDVAGKSLQDAQRLIQARGLESTVERQDFSETVQEGFVISQDPQEGVKAPKASRVALVTSKGPETVEVPSVVGKTRPEAERALAEAGLQIGNVTDRSDDKIEAGKVLSQDPAAGEKINRSVGVDLVISKGQALARVPDLIGLSSEDAGQRLTDAGLKTSVKTICDPAKEFGKVTAQDPAPRQEVPKATTVTITVNSGGTIPSVVGQDEDDAVKTLRDQGFKVEVQKSPSIVSTGKVIAQDPASGQTGCDKDEVTITVL